MIIPVNYVYNSSKTGIRLTSNRNKDVKSLKKKTGSA